MSGGHEVETDRSSSAGRRRRDGENAHRCGHHRRSQVSGAMRTEGGRLTSLLRMGLALGGKACVTEALERNAASV